MRAQLILLLGLFLLPSLAVEAQFPVKLPKLPKIKQEKPKEVTPPATTSPAENGTSNPTVESGQTSSPSQAADVCREAPAYSVWLDDMEKTRKEAEEYTPESRDWYVSQLNDRKNIYLLAAISPRERKDWLDSIKAPEAHKCFVPLFDAIAAAAKKTLPSYHPTRTYVAATPADRKAMLAAIEGVTGATVFKATVHPGPWEVDFPVDRYKHGEVWLKWPNADDGYCRIYYVNVVQKYEGGGRYGGSYGRYIYSEPAGCPAGK